MSEERKAVRISEGHYDQIVEIAEERGISLGECMDVVLGYGISRINTLGKYNAKVKKAAKKEAKEKAAKSKAKKAKTQEKPAKKAAKKASRKPPKKVEELSTEKTDSAAS